MTGLTIQDHVTRLALFQLGATVLVVLVLVGILWVWRRFGR